MKSHQDLKKFIGLNVSDDGFFYDLNGIIEELESFAAQFDTHSMNEGRLELLGRKSAYEDVIDYLRRIKGD